MGACLVETEDSVYCQPDLSGVGIFLAVVLPPAHGAELEGLRGGQGPVSAAGAAIEGFHGWMDEF
jgi:hypothetical protein